MQRRWAAGVECMCGVSPTKRDARSALSATWRPLVSIGAASVPGASAERNPARGIRLVGTHDHLEPVDVIGGRSRARRHARCTDAHRAGEAERHALRRYCRGVFGFRARRTEGRGRLHLVTASSSSTGNGYGPIVDGGSCSALGAVLLACAECRYACEVHNSRIRLLIEAQLTLRRGSVFPQWTSRRRQADDVVSTVCDSRLRPAPHVGR